MQHAPYNSHHQVRVRVLGDEQGALQHVNFLLAPLHLFAECVQGLQSPAKMHGDGIDERSRCAGQLTRV